LFSKKIRGLVADNRVALAWGPGFVFLVGCVAIASADKWRLRMNKLGVLILAIAAFGIMGLPHPVTLEMDALTDEQMEEQSLYTPDFYFPLESERDDVHSESYDDLEDSEEDKLENYLRAKSESELLAPKPEAKVDQLKHWEYVEPSGNINRRDGRTLTIEKQEYQVGKHDTAPPNPINRTTP
jgi:hypothetical protein